MKHEAIAMVLGFLVLVGPFVIAAVKTWGVVRREGPARSGMLPRAVHAWALQENFSFPLVQAFATGCQETGSVN